MVKFLFLGNADTGGQNTAIARAIRTYTKHDARSIRMNDNYIHFPYDLCRDLSNYSNFDGKYYSRDDILEIVRDTDIIVFDTYDRFYGYDILFEDHYLGKRVVYRHNGDQYRLNPLVAGSFHRMNNDALVVSTPDLLKVAPRIVKQIWLPNVVIDEDYLNSLPTPEYDDMLCVGHSPTNPKRKGTFEFIRALGNVAKDIPIDFDLIARRGWYDAVRYRAMKQHIYFDQIQNDIKWYGNASIEAAWIGQPVICNELLIRRYAPFFPVDFADLEELLRCFFTDVNEDLYKCYQERHMKWARELHSPKANADEHANWMIANATEWTKDHKFNTDVILGAMGIRWEMGKGIKL